MKHYIITSIVVATMLLNPLAVSAQNADTAQNEQPTSAETDANDTRHHFRLGYGSSFIIHLLNGISNLEHGTERTRNGATGPITLDYQYRINNWFYGRR